MNHAKRLYEAYGQVTNFKNYQGNPMPTFEDLPDTIKTAWEAVADEAITAIGLDNREHAQIRHAMRYYKEFQEAGIPGHGQLILIAKLAQALSYPE